MSDYLTEVEYATQQLISVIWEEREKHKNLDQKVKFLTAQTESGYMRAQSFWDNAEDPDDVAMGAGMHWDTYFGADKERYHANEELQKLSEQIQIHEFSIGSLAGSLLQIAKQGISLVHQGRNGCPDGRLICDQPLKEIIWQGRNQSIHWEEGQCNSAVNQCFTTLSRHDEKFSDYTNKNMAFEVINLLEWNTFDQFRNDMLSLS